MGEWEDLEKALNDFVDWADDFFELEREEEIVSEYPDEIPLRKDGTPDMRFKINKELFGEEEYVPSPEVMAGYESPYADEVEVEEEEKKKEEEEEVWYAYYWTVDEGYWGTTQMEEESGVYYSKDENMEDEVYSRIISEYGDRYINEGFGGYEVEPSVDEGYEVDEEDVDKDLEL
jgi:hypothetical protein